MKKLELEYQRLALLEGLLPAFGVSVTDNYIEWNSVELFKLNLELEFSEEAQNNQSILCSFHCAWKIFIMNFNEI